MIKYDQWLKEENETDSFDQRIQDEIDNPEELPARNSFMAKIMKAKAAII